MIDLLLGPVDSLLHNTNLSQESTVTACKIHHIMYANVTRSYIGRNLNVSKESLVYIYTEKIALSTVGNLQKVIGENFCGFH